MSIPATCLLAHTQRVAAGEVWYNRFHGTNEILALDRAKNQMQIIIFRAYFDDSAS
jgi:hypothetical protein